MTARSEPRLVTVIKRLAELEARSTLTFSEMQELNRLRIELEEWPEVAAALAHAYLQEAAP